ncbi:MAG: metallophosphoesterase [Lachnospiraceae bacterium]|nr:metallophosphoesterase [Lachnospiraceae bacterium]
MLYFTSDLHLDHKNVIEFSHRPFMDVEEMNKLLIDNINYTVGSKDELYIIGDFLYPASRERVRELRRQIKCKHVHLIRGNHDKDYSQDHIFQSVQDYKEIKTEYGRFVLSHYQMQDWSGSKYGSVLLHWHIHSEGSDYNERNRQMKYLERFPDSYHIPKDQDLMLRMYDVGVDANDYKPVSLEPIADFLGLTPVRGSRVQNEEGL